MLLRPAAETDLPALLALDRECFPPEIAYSLAELRHFLLHASSFSIVAEEPGGIAGFAAGRSVRRRVVLLGEFAPAFHVITIDVARAARRRGVGTRLMEWIAGQARAVGARAIVLESAENNLGAHRFYARHGFRATGTIPGYYNAVLDALTFERLLDSPQRPGEP